MVRIAVGVGLLINHPLDMVVVQRILLESAYLFLLVNLLDALPTLSYNAYRWLIGIVSLL